MVNALASTTRYPSCAHFISCTGFQREILYFVALVRGGGKESPSGDVPLYPGLLLASHWGVSGTAAAGTGLLSIISENIRRCGQPPINFTAQTLRWRHCPITTIENEK